MPSLAYELMGSNVSERLIFDRGWNAAIDEVIRIELSRVVPDRNRVRDLEALKKSG